MKKYIRPEFLKEGDTIALVAMASSPSSGREKEWLQVFESWGLKVKQGEHLFDYIPGEFAGKDEDRVADIEKALKDPEVKAIISFRGGYGSMRTVSRMDLSLFAKYPKWIVGYSDITIFHAAFRTIGMESILGEMPCSFLDDGPSDVSRQYLHDALFGKVKSYHSDPHPFSRQGTASGRLVGGNLCLFQSTLGTPWGNQLRESSILVIEDIDERMLNIDRMLLTLEQNGILGRAKGVIVGHFTDVHGVDVWERAPYELIREYTDRLNVPVLFGFPCGHEHPNYSLYMGREVELKVDETGGTLTFK